MERYVADIRSGLDGAGIEAPLTIMQSSGGVMTADDAKQRPVLALESGPAAGVVAALGDGAAARLRERDRVRHGRHDREGVADRGRRRLARPRVRGRRLALGRQPADARRGRAAAHPDDRHRRGRRGRRLDRVARPGGRAAGRAAQRGRRARAGLLRARRRGADRHRRERRARLHPGRAARRRRRSRSRASSPSRRSSASPSRSGSRRTRGRRRASTRSRTRA